MLPILPRQLLWKNLSTMDEFFQLDPVNEAFFEVLVTLREEPFAVHTDEVKVFNEVYYQITRMIFEHPLPGDLQKFVTDIKANMGWNYSAELVMSMAYYLIALIDKQERPLNKFFTKAVYERFFGCLYWKPFKHCFEKLKKKRRHIRYNFRPRPVEAVWLKDKYVNWSVITCNFNLLDVEHVLELWDDRDDRIEVAQMIHDSVCVKSVGNSNEMSYLAHYLEVHYLDSGNDNIWMCMESSYTDYEALNSRIEELCKEKQALQQRISELEAENNRLTALLEKKKSNGTARKFTLVQIVDYCKGCVTWDDVKSIVAMLNKLLRRIATEEDSDLVDSIEAEFINRHYGHTFNGPVGQFLEHVERVENKSI